MVHAIAFSDKDQLDGRYLETTADNFSRTMLISCYSLTAIAQRAEKLMTDGGSILTLTYYGAEKWMPHYNVMGVAKAALEASVRYLAADLGEKNIRVNAISAGPIKTLAASGIGDFRYILKWNEYNSPMRRTVTHRGSRRQRAVSVVRPVARRHRRGASRRFRLSRRRHEAARRARHLALQFGRQGIAAPSMPTPTIYYIRHGETSWNAEGRLQGTLDIPLNDRGRTQAAHAGHVLADLFARDGRDKASLPFVASPLGRARSTMELVRGTCWNCRRTTTRSTTACARSAMASGRARRWPRCRQRDPELFAQPPDREMDDGAAGRRDLCRGAAPDARLVRLAAGGHRRRRPWRHLRGR